MSQIVREFSACRYEDQENEVRGCPVKNLIRCEKSYSLLKRFIQFDFFNWFGSPTCRIALGVRRL
jgi:hypothetical protein